MTSGAPLRLARRLAGLLPTDPEYAPFGIAALRGLGVMPLALVAGIGLALALQRVVRGLMQVESWWATVWRSAMTVLQAEVAYLPMLVLLVLALNRAGPGARRVLAMALALAVGVGVCWIVWGPLFCVAGRADWSDPTCTLFSDASWSFANVWLSLFWGSLLAALLWFDRREREASRRLAETRLARIEFERQETEAQLRALQAQIEPHFLFNTLAHVQRFQQVDATQGRAMLASLIDYMRAALPQMREPESTLRRELALVRAYAGVQQIRMGERLRFEVDVPDDLLDLRVPPMIVLTLAENAVKHGLSPRREGGLLRIAARRDGSDVLVEVVDDGVGLRLGSGSGTGLANTRARLAARYGRAAALAIGNNADGPGVRAELRIPAETPA
jgi:hypothetical protein